MSSKVAMPTFVDSGPSKTFLLTPCAARLGKKATYSQLAESTTLRQGSIITPREGRDIELKKGHGRYMYDFLPEHLRKYGCAFLNGDGGSLVIGVNDDGCVSGTRLAGTDEIYLRNLVSRTFKTFTPAISSNLYSMRLIPVESRYIAYKLLSHLFVIDICVQPGDQSEIYETCDHKVYVKRDGSVEELNSLQIGELAIKKYQQTLAMRQRAINEMSFCS